MSDDRTLYGVLGVDRSATEEEIKTAYYRAATLNHPDRGGDTEKMATINRAYMVLTDANNRAKYDKELELFGELCPKCDGAGRKWKTHKNLRDRSHTVCVECNGHGILRWLRKRPESKSINLSGRQTGKTRRVK